MGNQDINVGHLLQMQADMTKAITDAVRDAKDELRADLAAVKAKQDITNGRVSRTERVTAKVRLLVDRNSQRLDRMELRFADSASIFASMTKAQKVKLGGFAVVVAGAAAAGVQKLIPVLVTALTARLNP